ncbi:MAG: RyR domain-containing protein, partial [Armatimonadota bacterium]
GDMQDSNRAAARRIAANLGLIDFQIVPMTSPTDLDWQAPLEAAIKYHLERMARAEHLGWNSERYANGWTYAEVTDKAHKKHSSLVQWDKLPATEQAKDRDLILWIKDILVKAQHKAIRDNTP